MDAVIFNFENLRQAHLLKRHSQKEKLIQEFQSEIRYNEAQIRSLVIQINQLQSNIDLNLRLLDQLNRQ